jgi:hypothetical protein
MKPVKGYEEAKAMGEGQERLPVDGYIVKILNVEEVNYEWGSVIVLSYDIVEGEYAGYYKKNYGMQSREDKKWKGVHRMNVPKGDGTEKDEWTMSAFKRDIEAFEDSNSGFHWDWDEKKLKGLVAGAVMQDREYELNGNTGFWTACHHLTSVERIREGKFKIPKPKMLDRSKVKQADFVPLAEDELSELPF